MISLSRQKITKSKESFSKEILNSQNTKIQKSKNFKITYKEKILKLMQDGIEVGNLDGCSQLIMITKKLSKTCKNTLNILIKTKK